MAKYDCSKAKDFLHEAARLATMCTSEKELKCSNCPMTSEIDGHRVCVISRIIDKDGKLYFPMDNFDYIINELQKWSDSHPYSRKELSADEIAVLTGLKLLGYKFLAADLSGLIWGYDAKPKKKASYWSVSDNDADPVCVSKNGMFGDVVNFSDEEPIFIDDILCERN